MAIKTPVKTSYSRVIDAPKKPKAPVKPKLKKKAPVKKAPVKKAPVKKALPKNSKKAPYAKETAAGYMP